MFWFSTRVCGCLQWGYKRSLRSTSTWQNPWTQQCHRTNQTFWKLRGKINKVLPCLTNFQQTQISLTEYDNFCVLPTYTFWTVAEDWLYRREKEKVWCRAGKEVEMDLTCTCSRWYRARQQEGRGRRGQEGSQIQQISRSPVNINLQYLSPARLLDHLCEMGTWARCHITEALLWPSFPWQSPES